MVADIETMDTGQDLEKTPLLSERKSSHDVKR